MKKLELQVLLSACALAAVTTASAQSPADRPLPVQKAPVAKPKLSSSPNPGGPALPAGNPERNDLQPLPEPPPPPPGFDLDPSLEPQVTIQRRGTETVEEFRVRGRLYMIKVTPAHGVPYYLIDDVGRGEFTRRDSYDTGTRVPMWVIHQF